MQECSVQSARGQQHAGVCRGCPLSPVLFGILMTVLMNDAYSLLGHASTAAVEKGRLLDVLYADDILLIGGVAEEVEELARAIERVGGGFRGRPRSGSHRTRRREGSGA